MKPAFSLNRWILILVIPTLTFITALSLTFTEITKQHPELYSAITYDLILTTPLLAFFLSKRQLPKWSISIMIGVGILTAWLAIPHEHQQHLNYIRFFILPFVELFIVGSIIYFIVKTIKKLQLNTDYLTTLIEISQKTTGNKRTGIFFGTEFAMLYYSLFSWKKNTFSESEFSSHHTSGITSVYAGILIVLIAELIGMHFLLLRWNKSLAWVIFIASVYSMLLLFGWLKATLKRPVSLDDKNITIRNGLSMSFNIPFSTIERIELSEKSPEDVQEVYRQSLLGEMEPHNIILYLKESVVSRGIYGKKKNCRILLLHIDDKNSFYASVKIRLTNSETV